MGVNIGSTFAGDADVKTMSSAGFDGNTLYVGGSGPNNYTTIQSAIDDAVDGDSIFVYSGIYNENLIIHKSINLIGENRDNTIIDGMEKEFQNILIFENCQFNLSCFTIRNGSFDQYWTYGLTARNNNNESKISNCIFSDCFYGIFLDNTSNVIVDNCVIYDNTEGIMLLDATNCVVRNCDLANRQRCVSINLRSTHNLVENCMMTRYGQGMYGVDIYGDYNTVKSCIMYNECDGLGIKSNNNIIQDCTFINNSERGIVIWGDDGNNNLITNCLIYNNGYRDNSFGIEILDGSNNHVHNCNITNNAEGGILILFGNDNIVSKSTIKDNGHAVSYPVLGSGVRTLFGNYIYENNFINNKIQAVDGLGYSQFNNGELGNYWNNYDGIDSDYDGIGDTPHMLYDDSNQDDFPLILPYGEEPSVKITSPNEGFLYFRNLELFPLSNTIIFGNIKVKALAASYVSNVERVEFYVDGILRKVDDTPPYDWRWRLSSHIKHRHTLTVVTYDNEGLISSDEIMVWRFL